MLGSGAGGKKPIKEEEKLRARKAKLERVSSELTKHKNADEKLYKARADWEKTFDAISDWIALIDLKGRILRTNRSGEDFTGISSAQIVGQSCCKLVHASEEHIPGCPLQKMLHTRRCESAELKEPDTNRWLIVTVDPLTDKEGNLIGAVHITRDITDGKRAEQALCQSEEKFRSIFDNANDIIASVTKTGKILEVNKKIEDILGYKPDELIGKNFMTLGILTTENAAKMFHFFKESVKIGGFLVSRDGHNVTEVWVNHKDGHTVLLEANTTTIKEDGKLVGYLSVIRDITERKKAEEAYRSLVDHSLQGLAIFQDGRVVFANQAMADITGYTVDEMLTLPPEKVQEFVHPDDRELVWNRHRDRLNSEELPERYEFRGIRKDGSMCWVEIHASRIEYQGKPAIQAAYVDITEEKRAREALRESRDYLQRLTNSMWDAVFSVKIPERVIEWANDSFRLIGYEPEECIGKTTEFLYLDDSEFLDFGNKLKGAMAAGKDVLHAEQILKRKNSKTFPAEIITTFFREKGEIVRVTSIVRDITERKKAEEVIAKLAKFPDEDPYPVLRISGHGTVIYANTASAILLKVWCCRVGESLPDQWQGLVLDALSSGQSQQTEVKCDGRIFSLTFAPIVDTNYVNIYGLDITERKKAEDELVEYQMKLKAMAFQMLRTEERERQRLAVGLHDEVCQKLVLTKLAFESSLQLVSDSKVLASLRIACGGIGETIEQANSLTFELSNPVLRQLGFVIALEKYLTEEIRQKHGIEYELQSDEQLGTLPDEIKNCLFRVTRELLTNVVKHAHARKVKVSARESQSQIYVRVQDDGVGFKESQAGSKVSQTARFGLFSIREQLEYLGGHLEIESEPGQGTKATMVVPLRDKATV